MPMDWHKFSRLTDRQTPRD